MSDQTCTGDTFNDQRILAALRKAQASAAKVRDKLSEPLAVIGIGCRFPGAENPREFWQSLSQARNGVTETPASRRRPTTNAASKTSHHRKGAFLDNVDQFDASFFGIAGREAATLDPQQRLLLEVTWETLEDATLDAHALKESRTGVFVGICSSDYWCRLGADPHGSIDAYWGTGNAHGAAAGRLSYFMDWRGPCAAFDTACSSSLTALHFASRSLRYGDCDLALVAGVNLMLNPELTISFDQAGMLSTAGACQTFSAAADGFVRGEGCGAILLKRLSQAEADGDRIYCLIRGSALNQDGRSIGLTAPNGVAQQTVIRKALADARVEPDEVDYLEAHGTGTPLGDPIEMGALAEVFAANSQRQSPLQVGSVKTNIGHLEAAAGIAGLIKVCLGLDRQAIPAHLHFNEPSPHIDWNAPLEVPTEQVPWPRTDRPRIAGVSSFGFGGTNAHVVLAEAPLAAHSQPTTPVQQQLLTISAKSGTALKTLASEYANSLRNLSDQDSLEDFCYTARVGRAHFDHRLVVRGTTADELADGAQSYVESKPSLGCLTGTADPDLTVGWRFGDEGSIDIAELQGFFELEPKFAERFEHYAALFHELAVKPEVDSLSHLGSLADGPESLAIRYCSQLAAADLWRSWGIVPQRVFAQGTGDYAAACISGVFSPEDGARLIKHHIEILRKPGRCGQTQRALCSVVAQIDYQRPLYEYSSDNLVNQKDLSVHSGEYWQAVLDLSRKLPKPTLRNSFPDEGVWLDIGPRFAVADIQGVSQNDGNLVDPSAARNVCLAQLFVSGARLCWRNIHPHGRRTTDLPTYPFERKRHWYESSESSEHKISGPEHAAIGGEAVHPLLGKRLDVAGRKIFFESDMAQIPFLDDHRIGATTVLPMSGFLELALSAGRHATDNDVSVLDLRIDRSLMLTPGQVCRVQVVVSPDDTENSWQCQVLVREFEGWQSLAECRLTPAGAPSAEESRPPALSDTATAVSPEEHYAHYQQRGLHHGPSFRGLRQLWTDGDKAWGRVDVSTADTTGGGYFLHPALLDGCLQVVGGALGEAREGAWLPVRVDRYELDTTCQFNEELSVFARRRSAGEESTLQFDLDIRNSTGRLVAVVTGLVLKPVPVQTSTGRSVSDGAAREQTGLVHRILQAQPYDQPKLMEEYLLSSVADIMGLELDEIPPDAPLDRLGLDSMMAFELQQDFQENLGIEIGMERFMQDLTLCGLGEILMDTLRESNAQGNHSSTDSAASATQQRFVEGAL